MTPSLRPSQHTTSALRKSKDEFDLSGKQTFVKIHHGEGKDRKTFTVQKSIICHLCPFFNAAFNGPFVEGETQEMTVTDVEPEILSVTLRWLITTKITGVTDALTAAKLWVYADYLLLPDLQNATMKKLTELITYISIIRFDHKGVLTTMHSKCYVMDDKNFESCRITDETEAITAQKVALSALKKLYDYVGQHPAAQELTNLCTFASGRLVHEGQVGRRWTPIERRGLSVMDMLEELVGSKQELDLLKKRYKEDVDSHSDFFADHDPKLYVKFEKDLGPWEQRDE